ncbi:MAG: glycosyltransferase [Prevotella sp.]|nr:glycosyltransferase [Prevotella sp.]
MNKKESRFSVVMMVYDNGSELEEHLPAFLTQDYETGYEVIVVDESSTDNTDDVLKLQKKDNPHLYTTFLPKPNRHTSRRKLGLTIGVKAAKNEWVILSDIHAAPPSQEWLKEVAENIDDTTDVILGYYTKKGLRLQAFEETSQAMRLVRKAERLRADGHKGRLLKYLRGKYDFAVVRTEKAHDLLKYYEQDVSLRQLSGLRLLVMWNNLH